MRAIEKQIPESKPEEVASNHRSNGDKPDTLWAMIRRLMARVKSLEEEVSTLRRDVNATRKKVYREEDKLAPAIALKQGEVVAGIPDGFFR